jgi:hypothetical protein
MNRASTEPLSPPPGFGSGEAWRGRVRRYLWADEDPRSDIGEPVRPSRPSPNPLPTGWGEGGEPTK